MVPTSIIHALPPVPLTIEGASVLHQMFRVKWERWKAVPALDRTDILREAVPVLAAMENDPPKTSSGETSFGQSALFSLLGHKGDLMLVHFRNSFDELNRAEFTLNRLRLWDFFEPTHSYLSVVELGLYESSVKTYTNLSEQGVEPHTPEWNSAIAEVLERQREAMHPRLFPEMPPHRYVCFYPMDRKRAEAKNWYQLPMAERQRQMHEHGLIGRRYAGEVRQIITGSIGFDDWEWGVDLFADDPLVFKKLIYEMRFDEVSAVYALFGSFYVGIRCRAELLGKLLEGELPA